MQRAIHPEEVDVTPLTRNPLRTLVCRQVVIAPEGGERARFLFFAAAPPRSIEGRHPSCATHFEPWLPAEGVIAGGGRAHPVSLAAPMKGVERCRRVLVAFSERYLVVWCSDGGPSVDSLRDVSGPATECGTACGRSVALAQELQTELCPGCRISCSGRLMCSPRLACALRVREAHARAQAFVSMCARDAKQPLTSIKGTLVKFGSRKLLLLLLQKNKSAVFACDRPNWGTYDI